MEKSSILKAGLAAGLVALLAACGQQTQTTSGSKYLAAYSAETGNAVTPAGIDADIAAAAAVEPQLRFPARLGLARIEHGRLTSVPQGDAVAWRALAERLGGGYGTFQPVSPLIAALATTDKGRSKPENCGILVCRENEAQRLAEVVRQIRLGAARQHLDAVLIYETFGKSEETSNPLAVTKLALIGFFLPTEDVAAEGFAQAVLVDVRNGYTYGTASAVADKPVQRITTSGNSYAVQRAAQQIAQVRAVENLTGEVEAMLRDLRLALAEGRLAGDIR